MNLKPDSKIIIQGITEDLGFISAAGMKAYGTNVVAGISIGQGGNTVHGIPVFDLVQQALAVVGPIDATIIFVEPYAVLDAALEAIAAGIRQIILPIRGIPPLDMVSLLRKAEATQSIVLGPGSAGIIFPGKALLGIHSPELYTPGTVGIISLSRTLSYEIALELTNAGLGQSMAVNLGSEPMIGSFFREWLPILAADKYTKAIVVVGQTGGTGEEAAAAYIAEAIDKPVVAYIAGQHLGEEKRLSEADAIIFSQMSVKRTNISTMQRKISAFKQVKIPIAELPAQIPILVKKALKKS